MFLWGDIQGYDLNDIPIGLISNQLVERVRVIYEMSCLPVDGIVRRCDPPFAENGSPEVGNNSKRMNNGMNCGCECTSVEEG